MTAMRVLVLPPLASVWSNIEHSLSLTPKHPPFSIELVVCVVQDNETTAYVYEMLQNIDTDRDGSLSWPEFWTFMNEASYTCHAWRR